MAERRMPVDGRDVTISRPGKVLYPDSGLTKADLADYYRRVAPVMLPLVAGHAATLHRFPDGIAAGGFFQQRARDHFPDFVRRADLPRREGGTLRHVVLDNAATLAWLADQAVLAVHVWQSRADASERPRRLVLDLDPPGDDLVPVRFAARRARELLEDLGLAPMVMTTGSNGLHVVAPLDGEADFEATRALARDAAALLADRHPDRLTVSQRKSGRRGRVYLDTTRNAYGQTAVAPYSVRALPGAPVATPMDWDELDRGHLSARRWNVGNIFRRLSQKDAPWRDFQAREGSVRAAAGRLAETSNAAARENG